MASGSMQMSDPILKVDHLSMKFGGLVAVNDLSFEARRGEITALIGPNGAGKTTVFNCITGFYKPTEGMMTLKRKNGETYLLERMPDFIVNRQAKVARTFQNIRLFSGLTLLENLLVAQHNALMKASAYSVKGLLGLPSYRQASKASVDKARHWLDRIGLTDRADRPAGDLPYGAQRRMEIARAMCTEPELLCLDEPAAGLNPRESAELNNLLTAIPTETGTSILLIEHDMSVVMEISDHVVVLEYGTKISDGDPDHVKSDPKVIAAYLGVDEDEAEAIVASGPESIIEGFDGEPDAAHGPRNSSSMMAGPIDQTVGHSAGGETIKVSPGASRANRVAARAPASAKPVAPAKKETKSSGSTAKSAAASAKPAAIMSAPVAAKAKPASTKQPAAKPDAKAAAKPAATTAKSIASSAKSAVVEAKTSPEKMPSAKTAGNKPTAKPQAKAPVAKAPVAKSPVAKTPVAKTPSKATVKTAPAKVEAKAVSKPTAKPVAPKAAPARVAEIKSATAKSSSAKPSNANALTAKTAPSKMGAKPAAVKAAVPKGKAAAKPVAAKTVVAKTVVAKPDDLKLIKGIGPVNDAKLRAHGVTKFAQIAGWKKADIVTVEKYLEFDGRIAREDWIGQAKNLAKGGKPLRGGEK